MGEKGGERSDPSQKIIGLVPVTVALILEEKGGLAPSPIIDKRKEINNKIQMTIVAVTK